MLQMACSVTGSWEEHGRPEGHLPNNSKRQPHWSFDPGRLADVVVHGLSVGGRTTALICQLGRLRSAAFAGHVFAAFQRDRKPTSCTHTFEAPSGRPGMHHHKMAAFRAVRNLFSP